MTKKTELLAPAGDMERLTMALHYGADAVYLAGTQFGLRASAGNFNDEQLREAGVAPDLIRLSVGIEDIEDILADIRQALDNM